MWNLPARWSWTSKCCFSIAVACISFVVVFAVSVEEDLSLSFTQGQILDKFSERMKSKLTESYMTEPIYLVRWLRARNFNIDAADKMLSNHLTWRQMNRINELDNEDWSYFEEEFGYSLDTTDKFNRPVLTIDSGKWDVRQAVVSGQRDKLVRWMIKMMEDATKKVRTYQDEGLNVTRWRMLYNLGYFNLAQSGCFQCLSVYTDFVINYETHYPNTVDKFTLINTPSLFEIVLRLITPLFSGATRNSMAVFGTNKNEWKSALLKEIAADKLPVEYGGTLLRADLDD